MILDNLHCSICGDLICGDSHTSQPIKKGVCCESCFNEQVKTLVDFFFSELNRIKVDESE